LKFKFLAYTYTTMSRPSDTPTRRKRKTCSSVFEDVGRIPTTPGDTPSRRTRAAGSLGEQDVSSPFRFSFEIPSTSGGLQTSRRRVQKSLTDDVFGIPATPTRSDRRTGLASPKRVPAESSLPGSFRDPKASEEYPNKRARMIEFTEEFGEKSRSRDGPRSTWVSFVSGRKFHLSEYTFQSSNDYLREYLRRRPELLQAFIQRYALPEQGVVCNDCWSSEGRFRCKDCHGDKMLCKQCFIGSHSCLPFHRVQRWQDGFFVDTILKEMGFVLRMGHGGSECPHAVGVDPTEMIFADIGGFFYLPVSWCRCIRAKNDQWWQLWRMGYMTPSWDRPRTAFTVRLLDRLHVEQMECQSSMDSLDSVLRRLTNEDAPQRVDVSLNKSFDATLVSDFCLDERIATSNSYVSCDVTEI